MCVQQITDGDFSQNKYYFCYYFTESWTYVNGDVQRITRQKHQKLVNKVIISLPKYIYHTVA